MVILALATVTFAVGVARGEPATEMFTAAVALAVSARPGQARARIVTDPAVAP